ncbi:hypothetical protein JNUCC42_04085 [Brevibacterium sp. JNUCC-42]|nr:hypothetical protein JNUCC42_04085 [Brevibacterium sp. JNUCC-42]
MKKKILAPLVTLSLLTSFVVLDVKQQVIASNEVTQEGLEVGEIVSEKMEVTEITPEEFYKKLAQTRGVSVDEIRNQEEKGNRNRSIATANPEIIYQTYSKTVTFSKGYSVRYGVDAKVLRVIMGGSVSDRIQEIYRDTAFANEAADGKWTFKKDYVNPVLENDRKLVLRVAGNIEQAVTNGFAAGPQGSISIAKLLDIGFSYSWETSSTKYYRKYESDSTTFNEK